MRTNVCEPILDVYEAMSSAHQPIVGVVQGVAFGFGCAIASACDITIAHDTARFKLPEMERDLPPTLAISALLPKVGRKPVAWMVYSMDELDAAAAQQIGIVSKVAPSAQVEAEVAKLLATMTARTPEALVAVKDFLRAAPHMEPRGMADYGANLLAAVLSSAGK
jgi:enoyl-CoA hydratase/carnithine racemase